MSEASGNESSRKKNHKLKVPNLKRPGSPDASGASGNESSRKKQKLSNLNPGSIKIATNRKVSALRAGAGSGSESESTKRLKNKSKNTPSGSRATSPGAQSNGSRSGSPSGTFVVIVAHPRYKSCEACHTDKLSQSITQSCPQRKRLLL